MAGGGGNGGVIAALLILFGIFLAPVGIGIVMIIIGVIMLKR